MVLHFIHSRFIGMKTSRMIFHTFLLLLTIVVVAECSKLPQNNDSVKDPTNLIHKLEVKVAETGKDR